MCFFPPNTPHMWNSSVLQDCNSLPQLLQITNGFFFPSVLQFEIGCFSYKCQVCSRSGLRRRKDRLITQRKHIQISHTSSCVCLSCQMKVLPTAVTTGVDWQDFIFVLTFFYEALNAVIFLHFLLITHQSNTVGCSDTECIVP